jgi:hypothetical protein
LTTGVHRTPAAISRSRVGSSASGATSNATWFIDDTADTGPSGPGLTAGWLTPGTPSGALGNQKNASVLVPPMPKKKCWPIRPGSSTVFTSGKPSNPV